MKNEKRLVYLDDILADLHESLEAARADRDPIMRMTEACMIAIIVHLGKFPTVDAVEVVHGNWHIRCETHVDNHTGKVDEEFYLECSECHRKVWDVNQTDALSGNLEKICVDYPYCHCGAKMDGGADNGCWGKVGGVAL